MHPDGCGLPPSEHEVLFRRNAGEPRWQRTSSIHYDLAGRKTGMSGAELGRWRYDHSAWRQSKRQTDARSQTGCLYCDSLGRMRVRVLRTDESCSAAVTGAYLSSVSIKVSQLDLLMNR